MKPGARDLLWRDPFVTVTCDPGGPAVAGPEITNGAVCAPGVARVQQQQFLLVARRARGLTSKYSVNVDF